MYRNVNVFDYDIRFCQFCASIVWRVQNFFTRNGMPGHFSDRNLQVAVRAGDCWRAFLLEEKSIVDEFQIHVIPFGPIVEADHPEAPMNLNRYISRSVDMDIVSANASGGFIFAKLCRLMILGFMNMPRKHGFDGTRIELGDGSFGQRSYGAPMHFSDYLCSKARQMAVLIDNLSARQKRKSSDMIYDNADAIANSQAFEATILDYKLFGDAIFKNETNQE